MGLFGGGNSSSVFAPDNRSYTDAFNVASNPTLAVSDLGKVSLVFPPAPPANPFTAASGAALGSVDPRLLLTAGLIALAFIGWRMLR